MINPAPIFETRLAVTTDDIRAAQALRYRVFVEEMGAVGTMINHSHGLEVDRFDAHCEQLILLDLARADEDQVIGVYRLMDRAAASAAGQFYSESEYDLGVLTSSGRPLLEFGRSCLHQNYRGGVAMLHMWQALAQLVQDRGAEILFGVASFHGCNTDALAQPLSILARDYLAPADLRVRSVAYQKMDLCGDIDRVSAMKRMPALIKAYLRLGGFVGDGAFVDQDFNTTDICLVLDVARMNVRQQLIYGGGT